MPSGVALIPAEATGLGVDDPPPLRLRHVRKPPKNEPAGQRRAVGRLWGFGRAAALAEDGFEEIGESRKALRIADRGDQIVIANTGQPYREGISLQGARHSVSATPLSAC